jgi:hypothetical protein
MAAAELELSWLAAHLVEGVIRAAYGRELRSTTTISA